MDVQHISITISRPPHEVYDFASDPANLPRWASGLASSEIKADGDGWIAESPFGRVRICFVERNDFGIMDHDVELDSGEIFHNPMRVVANGEGSEFIFTLFRQPGMSDEQLADDRRVIEADLATLKGILETP